MSDTLIRFHKHNILTEIDDREANLGALDNDDLVSNPDGSVTSAYGSITSSCADIASAYADALSPYGYIASLPGILLKSSAEVLSAYGKTKGKSIKKAEALNESLLLCA